MVENNWLDISGYVLTVPMRNGNKICLFLFHFNIVFLPYL